MLMKKEKRLRGGVPLKYYISDEDRKKAINDTLEIMKTGRIRMDGCETMLPAEDYTRCMYITQGNVRDTAAEIQLTERSVVPMDSFEALGEVEHPENACVMNFACATTPGGGFLTGSRAQEECLCLQSTLYASLTSKEAAPYYRANRECRGRLRPVSMLYSPEVVVFRAPDASYLDKPVRAQVATIAAPNLKGRAKGVPEDRIRTYLEDSIRLMCRALAGRADTLILGAWGCGAFGNDPNTVAMAFHKVLLEENLGLAFKRIIFAVRDKDSDNFKVFAKVFKDGCEGWR